MAAAKPFSFFVVQSLLVGTAMAANGYAVQERPLKKGFLTDVLAFVAAFSARYAEFAKIILKSGSDWGIVRLEVSRSGLVKFTWVNPGRYLLNGQEACNKYA